MPRRRVYFFGREGTAAQRLQRLALVVELGAALAAAAVAKLLNEFAVGSSSHGGWLSECRFVVSLPIYPIGPLGATANEVGQYGPFDASQSALFSPKSEPTMAMSEPRIELRLASLADVEAMYPIHREAMRDSVVATWGPWDETYQQRRFRENFTVGQRQIIVVDGVNVGFMDVDWRADHVWLAEIEIAPAYQRRGIGGRLVSEILSAASRPACRYGCRCSR